MFLIGVVIVGITVLFMLGWIIALLVARKREGWIYEPYERKVPEGVEVYLASVSVTTRPPIDDET